MYEQIPRTAAHQKNLPRMNGSRPPSYSQGAHPRGQPLIYGSGPSFYPPRSGPDGRRNSVRGPRSTNPNSIYLPREPENLSDSSTRGRTSRKNTHRVPKFRHGQNHLERDRDASRMCKEEGRRSMPDSQEDNSEHDQLQKRYFDKETA